MKRLIFLFTLLLSLMSANSQTVKAPDFAFPKTVSADASADIKTAVKSQDAPLAINALIRQYIAQAMITEDSMPASIRLAETTAGQFANSPLAPIFDLLTARFYYRYYATDKWRFDRRELPDDAISQDLSEWSGQQFKNKITQLCQHASDNAEGLATLPTADYKLFVDIDSLSLPYFPTLLDFAYQSLVSLYDDIDSDEATESTKAVALKASTAGTASYFYWLTQNTALMDKPLEEIAQVFDKYSTNPYAGILLSTYFVKIGISYEVEDPVDDDFTTVSTSNTESVSDSQYIKRAKWLLPRIEKYLADVPNYSFREQLLDYKSQLTKQQITVEYQNLCAMGQTIKVEVNNSNVNDYVLNLYEVTNDEAKNKDLQNQIFGGNRKPLQSVEMHVSKTIPFSVSDTATFKIATPGYFVIVPEIIGETSKDSYCRNVVRCIPAYPMAVATDNNTVAMIVEPLTGAPINSAQVYVKNRKGSSFAGTSNIKGIADITKALKDKGDWCSLMLKVGGKSYNFSDVMASFRQQNSTKYQYQASVVTDRALYHQGEEAHVLAVLSRSCYKTDGKFASNLVADEMLTFDLYDANYQKIDTKKAKTDSFGRATVDFSLPKEGLTGQFHVSVTRNAQKWSLGDGYFTVSDYKMPDFELSVASTARDVPEKGYVTITGSATSYSGIPLSNVKITANVQTATWWRWFSPQEEIASIDATTDAEGKFSIVITPETFAQVPDDKFFMATIDGASPSGTNATASTCFSLGKQYIIDLELANSQVNGTKPFKPQASVLSPDGSKADLPLYWIIKHGNETIAQGKYPADIDLSKFTPDSYTLSVGTVDPDLADPATVNFTIYNKTTDIVPCDGPLWVENNEMSSDGKGSVEVWYGTPKDRIWMYYLLCNDKGAILLDMVQVNKGYHKLNLSLPKDFKGGKLYLYTVQDSRTYTQQISLSAKTDNGLKIEGESFRDKLIPTEYETWKLKVTQADGKPVEAALALDMYNKALDAITTQHFYIRLPYESRNVYVSLDNPYKGSGSNYVTLQKGAFPKYRSLIAPTFLTYDEDSWLYGYGGSNIRMFGARYNMKDCSRPMRKMAVDFDSVDECEVAEEAYMAAPMAAMDSTNELSASKATGDAGEPQQPEQPQEKFDFRDAEVALAVWAPSLTTDSQGNITYTFRVPNANTTWRLQAVAWSQDMKVGTLMRDFVTQKPVMVAPNAPRFLRAGDISAISCLVINNTDSADTITTVVEIFDPVSDTVLSSQTFTNEIAASAQASLDASINAPVDATAIGYRVKSSNGRFADGEQSLIRILPAEAQLIETQPFYLNPGETTFTTKLPDDKDARISLTFSENPAWTIVSAIPGLRECRDNDANSIAASLFSAAVAQGLMDDNPLIAKAIKEWSDNPNDSALISMLQRNEDLKIALLNCTPWVQAAQSETERMANLALIFNDKETQKAINRAINLLDKLQQSDGGWKWGEWCRESSIWVTANILEGLGDLKRHNWLPDNSRLQRMIERAVKFYDSKVEKTDWLYCLIRPLYAEITVSANGRKVIDATVKEINKTWKKYSNPTTKAEAAEIIHYYGEAKKAKEIMTSLTQFSVLKPSQGLTFPAINSLTSYAIILEAYGLINPGCSEIDGLLQQLIVRKQGTDWGSSVVTSQIVASILNAGVKWLVPAQGAKISAGSTAIEPQSPIESYTGALRADLSKYAGSELAIVTTGVGPAYGAVFSQFKQTIDKVEASACDDLSITKQMWVRQGTEWAQITEPLKVGDRVKVQLTIHSARNLSYVTINDQRPAAFEPVDQLPGWLYSEGAVFYRENRDAFTGIYIDFLSPGTYLLTYEMNVSHPGEYLSGVASIQSQYAPEISAHSAGQKLVVK